MGCRTCGADWALGAWSDGCLECGGGALELVCGLCFGTCGRRLSRAVLDSHDFHRAHWVGACGAGLSASQVFSRFQALAELLASEQGRRLSALAMVRGPEQADGELGVLHDWLAEQGVETGLEWLRGRLVLAVRRGRPAAEALLL